MIARALLAASVAGALALPACADAATTVFAGPIRVRDYDMTVSGTVGQPSLTVAFRRADGPAEQEHVYQFTNGSIIAPRKIRARLDRFGSMHLELERARRSRSALPSGCQAATRRGVVGVWRGDLEFAADTTYFHLISRGRLRGSTTRAGAIECNGDRSPSAPGATLLESTQGDTVLTAGTDTASVVRTERREGATILHEIVSPVRLDADPSVSAATLAGGGMLAGSAAFAGAPAAVVPSASGPPGMRSSGTLSGDLVASFDSIAPVPLAAAGTAATLERLSDR